MKYNYDFKDVEERLFTADLFGAFGKAVATNDRDGLKEILKQIWLDEKSMQITIEKYLPSGR